MPRAVLLGGVDEALWGRWSFAQELAQRAAFPRRYRMHAGISALSSAYMQAPSGATPGITHSNFLRAELISRVAAARRKDISRRRPTRIGQPHVRVGH